MLKPASGLRGIELINVPQQPSGYYIFQGDCCQLHPTEGHALPAMLRTQVELVRTDKLRQRTFAVEPNGFSGEIFRRLNRPGEPRPVFALDKVVNADERHRLRLQTEPLHGPFQLTLAAHMADSVPTNHHAVANWLHPSFY